MNLREAFNALGDGEKIRSIDWEEDEFVHVTENGTRLVDERGYDIGLGTIDGPVFAIFKQANPHQEGTFAWARFEVVCRGGRVTRAAFDGQGPLGPVSFGSYDFSPEMSWSMKNIDATDWKLAY